MTGESPVISWNRNRAVREKMDGAQCLIVGGGTVQWQAIDWPAAYRTVRTLCRRIYRATEMRDWKKVRSLQNLMLRSRANLLVSIRRVSQINRGKASPGVDARTALTPTERAGLANQLANLKAWKPLPVIQGCISPKPAARSGRLESRPSSTGASRQLCSTHLNSAGKHSSRGQVTGSGEVAREI